MDQRWLFSALGIEFFILSWPLLAEVSLFLAILGLGMTLIGVWGKRAVQLKPSQLLAALSFAALPASWLSIGYSVDASEWAGLECRYVNLLNCPSVGAGIYADLFFVIVLLVPIVLLVCGLGAIVSLDNDGRRR